MNTKNLRDNYPKLISHMETNSYSKSYINRLKWEINKILSTSNSKKWSCYKDMYQDYTKKSYSQNYLCEKRTIIGIIEHFDIHGRYPNGIRRHELLKRDAYSMLSPEFKAVIDYYCEAEEKSNKKASTIHSESHNASTFLLALQQKGMDNLNSITEEAVLALFMSSDGNQIRSYSYKRNIAAVFRTCISYDPEACNRILVFLPDLRQTRKNIQYLTSEETKKVKDALAEDDNLLSLRDKAIGLLVFYTGLRGCDIVGMTLDSIDWDRDLICIRQQKTERPIELPLTAVVGNAIYEYLKAERPYTKSRSLFISQNKQHDRLINGSISHVSNRIMKAAGIRQSKGDRKGFHIFRHHLATTLLGNGIPQPVISRTLGHISPDSLESYLSADFPHLKECAISIERFPVSGEVFS